VAPKSARTNNTRALTGRGVCKSRLIDSPDRLGIDRAGIHCVWHISDFCWCPWFCWWRSALGSDA
jgi:hypothetical protein